MKTLLETAAIRFTGSPRMLICPNCLSLTKHKVFQEADCVTVLGVPIARRLRREVLECEDCGDTHEVPGILAASGLERAGSSANAGAATRSPVMRVLAIAGIGVVGGQSGVNALAATFYPTDLRSTGVGAGLGIGRIGAIVGPVVGGQLLALHWQNQELFLAAAVPAAISALVMAAMRWLLPRNT